MILGKVSNLRAVVAAVVGVTNVGNELDFLESGYRSIRFQLDENSFKFKVVLLPYSSSSLLSCGDL